MVYLWQCVCVLHMLCTIFAVLLCMYSPTLSKSSCTVLISSYLSKFSIYWCAFFSCNFHNLEFDVNFSLYNNPTHPITVCFKILMPAPQNFSGVSENSRQSSTSTTPSVSPSPSPRNSVSQLAKPTSPSGSMSQLAKPSSPMGSMSQLAKPTGNKSSVPRANGPASAGQSQAVRRTKIAGDR